MTSSTENLDITTDLAPQVLPYDNNTTTQFGANSPKREAAEMYLKSKALLESRRKHPHRNFKVNRHFFHLLAYYSTVPLTQSLTDFHSFYRASHQRHWCFSKARHWNWLWLPCSGRRRSTTASKSMNNLVRDSVRGWNIMLGCSHPLLECISPGLHWGHRTQRSCRERWSAQSRRWAYRHWWSDGERSVAQAGAGSDDQCSQEWSSNVDCTQEGNLQRWGIITLAAPI